MMPRRQKSDHWFEIEGRWWLVFLAGGLIIGLVSLLEPVLEPYFGTFNAQAALMTFGLVVAIAFVVSLVSKLRGR